MLFLVLLLASVVFVFITTHHVNYSWMKNVLRRGFYPDLYPCHYTKLRPRYHGDEDVKESNILCKQRRHRNSSCITAIKYYGSPNETLIEPECPSKTKPDICSFKNTANPTLHCSTAVCKTQQVYLGKRDATLGDVRRWTSIKPFRTEKVVKFVQAAILGGETFCFIKCGNIMQVLVFPHILVLNKPSHRSTSNISINIILIDSLSRTHFYRMMRKSTKALRDLMEAQSATILDFELLQSIGTRTFENVRALFSGKVDHKKSSRSAKIGLHVLYQYYRQHGYQTVFQEDLCWYDRWGTVLDDIEMKHSSKATKSRWLQFRKIISEHAIDNYGMTFFSCEVFKLYNDTNHFEYPAKVCLNGKFFSSYFLQYLQDLTQTTKVSPNAAPYVSYTHLNGAHTSTGKRIRNMDRSLTQFINQVGGDPLTWTIILSDHGHKTTQYARTTVDGQYEATNPIMFMIVPQIMTQMLGQKSMSALVANQNRLITTLDLHHTLTSFLDAKKTGLFVEISVNRTCSDVPLMPLVQCQCQGNEVLKKKYKDSTDNTPRLVWMAEYALGQLNNEIQKQLQGETSPASSHCRRLIGSSFTNIIETGSQTTFDLHINASNVGLREPEVFKVAVSTKKNAAEFQSFERLTMYNKFKSCVDKSVDIQLCMCNARASNRTVTYTHEINTKMFQTTTITTERLYNKCLLKLTRNYKGGTSAIELVNFCRGESFGVEVDGQTDQVFLSSNLPMYVEVQPFQTRFLFSAVKQSSHYSMDLDFNVEKL